VSTPSVNPGWLGPWKRTTKWCSGCKRSLPFAAFRQQFATPSWLSSWCGECLVAANRRYRERMREQINAKRREEYAERQREARQRVCVECGASFEARPDALVCSRLCKDARYRRLHPEAYRAKQRRKAARRRERKR
jgi:hypothetical protein